MGNFLVIGASSGMGNAIALQLIKEGYGVENDKEEEIIDRWFRELCANVVVDGDFGGPLEGMATGNVDIETIKRDNK